MTRIAVIADDLTGAADAAVAFAKEGHRSRVLLDVSFDANIDVVAVTTESRHLPPAVAAQRVHNITHHLYGTPLLYKKIDSTLRGNIAHELLALMDGFDAHRALIAPAFPDQGRTTVYGRQLINGEPLEKTDFRSQVATSNLREIFLRMRGTRPVRLLQLSDVRRGPKHLTQLIEAVQSGLMIVDAETDDDLTTIARAARATNIRVISGSAGLCHALARTIHTDHHPPTPDRPLADGPVLTIAGSLHAASIEQVDAAHAAGIPVVEPLNLETRSLNPLVDEVVKLLDEGKDVILASHRADDSAPSDLTIADRLARVVLRVIERSKIGGLVLTGGDVASAVCLVIGARAIDLLGEVEPGIPYGHLRGGGADMIPIVTKAGGFGQPDTLIDTIRFLKAE